MKRGGRIIRSLGRPALTLALTLALTIALLSQAGCLLYRLSQVRDMPISEVDLATIPDGAYRGEYDYEVTWVGVEVTVADHQIKKIVVHKSYENSYGRRGETIAGEVVRRQKVDLGVDAVSGASTTGKAVLKAVENALLRPEARFTRDPGDFETTRTYAE
ncbi:MAG: FMN-binding protein [Deltaproteobacteria bacterium]|nr:FMN-binding protein [Deltaproteobacteria bacterium]